MEHRQAKTDEFFTKITSPPHDVFGGESGLSFLKERQRRFDPGLDPHAFVQQGNTLELINVTRWRRVDKVIGGRIREIHLPLREFLLLSLYYNHEILAKMIQITLLKVTGDVPGQPLLQQQIGAGQVQPLVQPGTIPWINRIDFLRNHVKGGFMRTHVGFPGGVGLVQGPDGVEQVIDLPPVMGASSGEFLDIYGELDEIRGESIFGAFWDFRDVCPYVWTTFWLELTGQNCGPSAWLVEKFVKRFNRIPGTFGTFALMNQKGEQWGLLHKFLVKFEEHIHSACLPGRIDSQEMNTFRDFLNGSEGGKDVIGQLIDFATEVIELFNAKWKRLAVCLPDFWYSGFYPRWKRILPADLRPFYEMFLMFSKAAPRDILVQVVQHNEREIVSVDYDGVFTVNGTTRYRFVQPDANDPENMQDKRADSLVLEAVENDKRRATLSENVEPDILVRSELWDIRPGNIPAGPGAGLLTFFKKPKIQKVHLFGTRESGTRCCRMRLSNDKEPTDPEPQLPNNQKFPSQVIIERSDWSKYANVNTELILKALSAAYPTYTQVVNVTIKGVRTDKPGFAPEGFIYKQVLFLFKVNGKEPHKHYASNTPIKILPDIWLEGNNTDRIADYINKRKEYPGSSFTVKLNIDQKVFTDTMRSLVKELDTGKIVWI